jgi:hypothetical protein
VLTWVGARMLPVEVVAWAQGGLSYRLGWRSAIALQLPISLVERIARLVPRAHGSGGGAPVGA